MKTEIKEKNDQENRTTNIMEIPFPALEAMSTEHTFEDDKCILLRVRDKDREFRTSGYIVHLKLNESYYWCLNPIHAVNIMNMRLGIERLEANKNRS